MVTQSEEAEAELQAQRQAPQPASGTITLGYDQPAGGYVRIYVKDTGMGIAKKKQAHVFDPYFTAENSTKNIGLGLTIADHLTKELGGQIGLTSELGRGSTFWFTVPFRPAISS
jgi:signal transduction histidine kinase